VETALEITRHQDPDGRTVLAVRGELDIQTGPRLRTALMEQMARSKELVLDVTGAVLIDAAGLRVLTAAQRHAADLGKPPITLRGVRPLFAKTLHLTGLDHLFPREPAPSAVSKRPRARPRCVPVASRTGAAIRDATGTHPTRPARAHDRGSDHQFLQLQPADQER
jgi:anti-anti-sigma factor